MITLAQPGLTCAAVGARLDRGVRRHFPLPETEARIPVFGSYFVPRSSWWSLSGLTFATVRLRIHLKNRTQTTSAISRFNAIATPNRMGDESHEKAAALDLYTGKNRVCPLTTPRRNVSVAKSPEKSSPHPGSDIELHHERLAMTCGESDSEECGMDEL